MNVMFVSDDNFVDPLIVTLNSLFRNNPAPIQVYLVSDGLKKKNQKRVEDFVRKNGGIFHYMECSLDIDPDKMQNEFYGAIVYQRIYGMFHIQEEKILYMDCDLVVDGSLKELYSENLDGYYAAAVRDSGLKQVFLDCMPHIKRLMMERPEDYFNSGVMLLNLKKIQTESTLESMMDIIERYGDIFFFPDQDLLNMVWNKKVKYVHPRYNRFASDYDYRKQIGKDQEAVVYHYAGCKPWEPWDRNGKKGYQWCVGKYLKYSRIPEAKNLYRLTKQYNFKWKDYLLSKIKEKRGYNPITCIKKDDWKTFWDYILFYI